MRDPVTTEKIQRLMAALGARTRGPGRIYFTGGTTALLLGWRQATVDVDLKLDPEPPGAFEAVAQLKDELGLNVELAAPSDFLPELPGWRERSVFIATHGHVQFYHYDFHAQTLAKIERGHAQDLIDVREMLGRGLVSPTTLRELFARIEPALIRYPAVDPDALRRKLEAALGAAHDD